MVAILLKMTVEITCFSYFQKNFQRSRSDCRTDCTGAVFIRGKGTLPQENQINNGQAAGGTACGSHRT
ncbi:MAG: hypothetical protein N2645_04600 [Clostridia bacterium]|nr:hypothetical protein [Clostridia bacterium]